MHVVAADGFEPGTLWAPSGYEPDELPLLHTASTAAVAVVCIPPHRVSLAPVQVHTAEQSSPAHPAVVVRSRRFQMTRQALGRQ